MGPTVSIIVPVYDVEEYLPRCVESVLAQTWTDWQLVLVDDGSPDDSGAICDRYAQREPRIRVVHQENRGLSEARNAGLDAATGDFVLFVDSDDWIHPDLLMLLLQHQRRSDADVVIARFLRTAAPTPDLPLAPGWVDLEREEVMRRFLGAEHTLMVVACGKLFRRSLWHAVSFPARRLHEDEFATHRALLAGDRFVLSDAVAYYYWQRPDSIMGAGYSLGAGRDSLEASRLQLEDVRRLGISNLTALAYARLARRLVHHFRWSAANRLQQEAASTLAELRELRRGGRRLRRSLALRAFMDMYATAPPIAMTLHSAYLSVGHRIRCFSGQTETHPRKDRHAQEDHADLRRRSRRPD